MDIGNFYSLKIRSYILFKPWWVICFYSSIVYFILNLGSSSNQSFKIRKYCANKYLWYTGNKFFTTMANCSSSLGLLIIYATSALHLEMKVENDSFGSSLMVSRLRLRAA